MSAEFQALYDEYMQRHEERMRKHKLVMADHAHRIRETERLMAFSKLAIGMGLLSVVISLVPLLLIVLKHLGAN